MAALHNFFSKEIIASVGNEGYGKVDSQLLEFEISATKPLLKV